MSQTLYTAIAKFNKSSPRSHIKYRNVSGQNGLSNLLRYLQKQAGFSVLFYYDKETKKYLGGWSVQRGWFAS